MDHGAEDADAGARSNYPPAGGLDMPPSTILEAEAFPGDSTLTEEERKRWLVLHFAIPRTLMTCDLVAGRSTEEELNDALSALAWGSVDIQTREWQLESDDPSLEPPHASLISYAEYVARTYPSDHSMEDEERQKNAILATKKRASFTNQGEPGFKFRAIFDQMLKNLMHTNKALVKAFDIKKVELNESEMPFDESKTEAQNIMRYGRYQVLPAFWQLLLYLTKKQRRFSIVLRSFGQEELSIVQKELQLFCQGQHPAYNGQNKTPKVPPMNGDKGSKDLRLQDADIGRFDRMGGRLEFPGRVGLPPAAGAEAAEARPSGYNFPPFHEAYAGLMHHVLHDANTAAILDDYKYWQAKDRVAEAGKLLLVDHAGGLAETKVQHIFFDGHIGKNDTHCVDVRDVVSGKPIPYSDAQNVFFHRVDLFQATTDMDYFVKSVEACELKMSKRIVESRRVAELERQAEQDHRSAAAAVAPLPPKEYLYRNIIPALLPALEACQRDRPADPLEFIAFYMLRHSKQYSKTLKS